MFQKVSTIFEHKQDWNYNTVFISYKIISVILLYVDCRTSKVYASNYSKAVIVHYEKAIIKEALLLHGSI